MLDSAIQAPLTIAFAGGQRAGALAARASRDEPVHAAEPDVPARPEPRVAVRISEAKFKALYDTHFGRVFRTLSRTGVREADLMDLTQKVFLTAYLKLPDFEGRSLLSTWLWGICRRVAIAYRRSSAIRYEIATDPLSLEASSDQRCAAAGEIDTARQVAAERILSKVPEPQRIVFTLFEVDGLAGPEIAARLKISLGTVRSRLRYARKVFRREVQRLARASALPKSTRQ